LGGQVVERSVSGGLGGFETIVVLHGLVDLGFELVS